MKRIPYISKYSQRNSSPVKQPFGFLPKSYQESPVRTSLYATVSSALKKNEKFVKFNEPSPFKTTKPPTVKKNAVSTSFYNKENSRVSTDPESKIEMFKNSKPSLPSAVNSQISTPRLTPLRMIERNRASDKTDIDQLELKI